MMGVYATSFRASSVWAIERADEGEVSAFIWPTMTIPAITASGAG